MQPVRFGLIAAEQAPASLDGAVGGSGNSWTAIGSGTGGLGGRADSAPKPQVATMATKASGPQIRCTASKRWLPRVPKLQLIIRWSLPGDRKSTRLNSSHLG